MTAATRLESPLRFPRWLAPAKRAFGAVDALFDRAFGSSENPLHQLGALSFYFFWIAAVTGIYIYIFFDTSVAGAYRSVQWLTEQRFLGGVMRSLHRYASDAFVLTMALHLLREFVEGRWFGFRWFSWITGVPLIWLVYASGLGGYWLVWDELAQFSLIATAEWLDWLPIFGEPIVHNFIGRGAATDRFFSLLIFLHIGIPLLLLLGMWIHIYRISHARSNPSRRLGLAVLGGLTLLSLLQPALSQAPADLDTVSAKLELDWIYMFAHPLMYASSAGALWAATALFTALLALLPLLPHPKVGPAAVVDLEHCNGCSRCFDDCPYVAITMVARSDGAGHARQAQVDPDLCASCGICAGACPSSTPFRTQADLKTGIDLPNDSVHALRAKLEAALAGLEGRARIVAFGCDQAVDVRLLADTRTATISLPCAGNLAPSFVDYALRNGADGVLITGCGTGNCHFRLGNQWLSERLEGQREPHLREAVERERLGVAWCARHEETNLRQALAGLRAKLESLGERQTQGETFWRRRHGAGVGD
ncbi:Cytochrome b6 [Burkholderiales bacterium]|nr:MAG: hydrogenase iron-sulfur subunit [Burkholderiales bacterium]CAG1003275.1 Cytochrome b6 [Burkholderiales bacterium]